MPSERRSSSAICRVKVCVHKSGVGRQGTDHIRSKLLSSRKGGLQQCLPCRAASVRAACIYTVSQREREATASHGGQGELHVKIYYLCLNHVVMMHCDIHASIGQTLIQLAYIIMTPWSKEYFLALLILCISLSVVEIGPRSLWGRIRFALFYHIRVYRFFIF